ncbi:DNA replication regulator sld2 [Arthrobotrys musiformis]|uniref:DNA replication regulator SLD2 n=1 Tax=Arthrobotrys musiformis TaxID=47236 RepID=A0AAV9WAM2_9PEZI
MANHPDTLTTNPDSGRLRHLKLKIKAWEKDFAVQNDGNPPSRQDISANPKMAARYSEYQKLKKQLGLDNSQTTKAQPLSEPGTITPRKPPARTSQTPLKTPSNPFFFTPTSRPELQGSHCSPSASAVRQLKWMKKGYVSPTPQKNGKVLGLFDRLPGMTPTPPKRPREVQDDATLAKLTDSAKKSRTVHSPTFDDSDGEDAYVPLDPTTPSRKRRYEFQTPLSKKNKGGMSGEPDPFSTPAIFRQHSLTFELKENGSPLTPEVKQFLPNRMIGKVKPLSALVRELREMQEEEDPGLEVLRELERGELNPTKAVDLEKSQPTTVDPFPESEAQTRDPDAENPPRQPVYKKKGLKRQTKRVKIRPVRATRTKSKIEESSSSDSELEDPTDKSHNPLAQGTEPEIELGAGDSESGSLDGEPQTAEISEDELVAIVPKAAPKKPSGQSNARVTEKRATTAKKTTVKADKHANYTRMKMHHKGKGFKGRGRGRR